MNPKSKISHTALKECFSQRARRSLEKLLGRKVDMLIPAGIRGIRMERVAWSIEESIEYI